jgi:pSer/pThr/pTyr-binding forkhead associated (FHA) protein
MMAQTPLGMLVSIESGNPYVLAKPAVHIGRRAGCDIVLPYSNVSGRHCLLFVENGYWMVEDLNSTNGTRVNGRRVEEHLLLPGDILSIAKHEYEIQYSPQALGAKGPPPIRSGSTIDDPSSASNVEMHEESDSHVDV